MQAVARGPEAYAEAQSLLGSGFVQLMLAGWTWAFLYHLCNGVRHLFWDMGYGFEIKDAYRSGWIVVGVSAIATAVSWIVGLRLV